MGASHQTLQTPDPQKRALAVTVQASVLVQNPNAIPPRGTLYKDFPSTIKSNDYSRTYGNYRYTNQAPNNDQGDTVLFFAPPMTEQERQTPFSSTSDFGNHYWHPILKSLNFIPDRKFPITTTGPQGEIIAGFRHYVRVVYIPGVKEGTLFTTDEYISDIPPVIPQYPTPTPTMVSYDYLDVEGTFPECLHEEIRLPSLRTAFATFSTDPASSSGATQGQRFPATNFTGWEPYVVSHKSQFTNGVWYHARITVTPPPEPEVIIR